MLAEALPDRALDLLQPAAFGPVRTFSAGILGGDVAALSAARLAA